jgi:ADP-ribose pyrophosphatase
MSSSEDGSRTAALIVDADERVGEGGFLVIRRLRLRNRRVDGSVSRQYVCDFLDRDKGVDAVVVAIFRRREGNVEVLLREGLRPPLHFGRDAAPVAEDRRYLYFREVVAGIIERGDHGVEGIARRACAEVWEEAGLRVAPDGIALLGAGTFPSPGAMAEKFWLCGVEVSADAEPAATLEGDGSPMEEGARVVWMPLEEAIAACVGGEIEDAKSELALRRLRDALRSPAG